ncbi:MAG TPA: ABC transporter permease [Chloroflexota bacterium]|nr:ABC transporter permease [Chloroflexota bacterium]
MAIESPTPPEPVPTAPAPAATTDVPVPQWSYPPEGLVVAEEVANVEAEKRYAATQLLLIRRRFVRNRVAVVGGVVILAFYIAALVANVLAPYDADQRFDLAVYVPPQPIYLVDNGRVYPHVLGLRLTTDAETLRRTYTPDPRTKVPLEFFVHGTPYRLFGLLPTDIHLFGVSRDDMGVFLLGTDRQGRDQLSRLLIGSQISLTIGLVGVFLSLLIGSVLGVASGYYGGWVDDLIQRLIEVVRSFPAIPLWMALAAAFPPHWPALQVYFAISVVLSLIGWTWLARQLRGKVLALREEEFVLATQLAGGSDARVIFRHLIPAVSGHIVVISTLAIPGMILAETALTFLGIGIRPPLVSWGTLLQDAQNIQTLAHFPWLLMPVVFIASAVLAFNFLGDGLRDAADPQSAVL